MKPDGPSLRRRVFRWLAALLLPLALAFGWFLLGQPGFGGLLAHATAPDHTDCVVTQTCNGSGGEPYTVSFYSRAPGGIWNWQYIDHEARPWFSCRMEIDAAKNEVKIYQGNKLQRSVELHPDDRLPEQKPRYLPASLKS